MLTTTVPSLIIALIVFTVTGLTATTASAADAIQIEETLQATYNISPWLLLVPVFTGILISRRLPAIVTLFSSVIMAAVAMAIAQPDIMRSIAEVDSLSFLSSFKAIVLATTTDTAVETSNPMLNDLVATSGMGGMMDTIWLIICAMCFGGAMKAAGMLKSITDMFIRFISGRISLVSSTVASGLFFNITTADQYISIVLTGSIFKNIYENNDYESRLLSRTIEDSVTVTSVLIPWNSCGMTQSTILNTSTLTYLPYCFFNIISPLMSIFIATIGYKIFRTKR
jgi:NhaC family Na+:H+ antiporter